MASPGGYPAPPPCGAALAVAGANGQLGSRTIKTPMEIDQMVGHIDARVHQVAQSESARLRLLADHAQRMHEGLQAIRVAREIHDERSVREVRVIEANVLTELSAARRSREELENRCEELSAQCAAEHMQEVQRHSDARVAMHQEFSSKLGDEVKRFTALFEEQRAARVENGERIAASLESEFQKVEGAVLAEQKLRVEAEGTMLKMVEDICLRMRGEIQQERQEREAVQGRLLGLLEDTCNRIETGIGVSRVAPTLAQNWALATAGAATAHVHAQPPPPRPLEPRGAEATAAAAMAAHSAYAVPACVGGGAGAMAGVGVGAGDLRVGA
eukprot:TRINITY_DN27156_c0_g2_i1.p1 TRINITY_DN27156_c0_g2~~TRINITY_DN27156_c0_g2_i1.p1  ORF type:complete len:329 (+),score=106.29 TRINITY_DN27156_c0_g2_i1:58-1044(+)